MIYGDLLAFKIICIADGINLIDPKWGFFTNNNAGISCRTLIYFIV